MSGIQRNSNKLRVSHMQNQAEFEKVVTYVCVYVDSSNGCADNKIFCVLALCLRPARQHLCCYAHNLYDFV